MLMDEDGEENFKPTDSLDQDQDESEDYSTFFLQPASSPYNIAQKVEEANIVLYNSPVKSTKSPKVRFKEDLVSFDAQLTDDDVASIDSDNNDLPFIEQQADQATVVLEYKTTNSNIFCINEDEEDEIIEEIECEMDYAEKAINKTKQVELEKKSHVESRSNAEEPQNNVEVPPTVSKEKKKKVKLPKFIDCRYHCIERLDTELSDSLRKLSLNEKPPVCPPLKLMSRKCCSENHKKNPTSLPKYDGLNSEYGLSLEQISRRRKIKEMIRAKEDKRQELIDDYKRKKDEINEEIFCKWLKDIAERKYQVGFKEYKMNLNKFKNSPMDIRPASSKMLRRPTGSSKTTSESGYSSKHSIEKYKRPKSNTQTVFVEVPKDVLRRGINLDTILNNFKYQPKKLYISTLS
ncbi:hypothetical protein WA026_015046 [Henosepilachna vigintioctopunctata]|uniref:Uncharacterized protein n=1 Tax=Henosepilachna vigintioctopunctata TaxID=420089 RepID=A0AAW1U720_9CUCU